MSARPEHPAVSSLLDADANQDGMLGAARPRSLKRRIAGLTAVVLLLLVAALVADQFDERGDAIDDALTHTRTLARTVNQHAGRTFGAIDHALTSTAAALAATENAFDPESLQTELLLDHQLAALPAVEALTLLNAEGQVVQRTTGLPGEPSSLAEMDGFRVHRDHPGHGLHIGTPMRSEVTGRWVIPLSQRVAAFGGAFGGVVLATVDPAYFQHFYADLGAGPERGILLLRNDGTVLATDRASTLTPGTVLEDESLLRTATVPGGATGAIDGRFLGAERVVGYDATAGLPYLAAVAVDRGTVLAQWRDGLGRHVAAIAGMGALVVFLAFLLARQIDRLNASNHRLHAEVHRRLAAEAGQAHALGRLKGTLGQSVEALARAVEKRDPYTAGHQERVAKLSEAIARRMGLPEERVENIRLGALMHDIGKVGIPAELLNKPGTLSRQELELIRVHPEIGYDIVRTIDFDPPVARVVAEHHERLDGSGYPKGLKGEEIALEARIVAVADVVEAITSHRPYRAALGLEVALAEIGRQRGRGLDAGAVDACRAVLDENPALL